MKQSKIYLSIIGLLLILAACGDSTGSGQEGETRNQRPLKAVCIEGTGVAEAAVYEKTSGTHPVALLQYNDDEAFAADPWTFQSHDLPEGWRSEFLESAELVICIDEIAEQEIETCAYTLEDGGEASITRWSMVGAYRILAAQTGEELDRGKFSAEAPECTDEFTFYEGAENAARHANMLDGLIPAIQDWVVVP